MSIRPTIYEWIARHDLDRARGRELFALAGLGEAPAALARRFWPVVAIAGAALAGLGVILWLAANWGELGRLGRFALLQAAVLVLALGAAARPGARPALGLLALLCTGGLFAYFGQTYQTGADPWQLFALWAALALPLCLGARSDVLWAPWALVAAVAISLWTHAHVGHRWHVEGRDLATYLLAWGAGVLLVVALSPVAARVTGAGPWALRTAGALVVTMVTLTALGALFFDRAVAPHYAAGLVLLAVAAALLCTARGFDVFLLSAVALALDTLLIAGAVRVLFWHNVRDPIGRLLLLGLLGAALLAASVTVILRVARRHHG